MENKKENGKKEILKRLKIIEGHLKKVISMVESNSYCIDILQQSSAVRNALKKVQNMVLSNHLRTCVNSVLKDKEGKKVVGELMDIYTQTNK
ncbi:MAG: metal-sensitive transcriptional regulator [bacterium]|nr:metal-sensitive transcriptional regulator [bacterium]